MKVVQLDSRLSLHPRLFNLSPGAKWAYLEGWMFLAANPGFDFIPGRTTPNRYARELLESGLWASDGGAYRIVDNPESGRDYPDLPRIAEVVDSKALDLAPKPKSSKSLVVEDSTVGLFERFWNAFDLKSGRKEAFEAFKKAIKRADPELIIERAGLTAEWFRNHPDPPKRKYAQGWLNRDRWEDELTPYPNPNGRRLGAGGIAMQEAADMERRGE